jgi:integral membrane protein
VNPSNKATASTRAALLRYRIAAYVVGVGLIILVCIGMPLKYWGDNESVVAIVGPLHGFLYMVFLLITLDLSVRLRWPIHWVLGIMAAGTIPFLSFVVERIVTRKVHTQLADAAVPAGQASA